MLQRSSGKINQSEARCLKIASGMNSEYNDYMNVSRGTRREKPPGAAEPEGPDPKGTLAAALALCRRDKISLTPGRRRILEILASEGRPLGAYEMIDRVAEATGKRPAPISIYRALDFLLENGLIHRLASRNAFLACGHGTPRRSRSCFSFAMFAARSSRRPPRRCAGLSPSLLAKPASPPRTGDGSRRPMPSLRTGISSAKSRHF